MKVEQIMELADRYATLLAIWGDPEAIKSQDSRLALRTAIEELYRDAAMQSEIDELREKLAALTRINSDLCRVHNERLLDKLRLATDAARYREIRCGQKWSVVDGIGDTLRADDLDAAIDAAMKEST